MGYINTKNSAFLSTSHGVGLKKVLENQGPNAMIPQIALGLLKKNEKIAFHKHNSLIEYYYVLKGKGEFIIDNETFYCVSGDFITVQNNLKHSINAIENLEFFYFGVNTEKNE